MEFFYLTASERMIKYGLYTHYFIFNSPNRSKFRQIDTERFYSYWVEKAVTALSAFAECDKLNQGVPGVVFGELYSLEVEPQIRQSGVGWWRRLRVESAFRDRFATGMVLGLALDVTTHRFG